MQVSEDKMAAPKVGIAYVATVGKAEVDRGETTLPQ